MNTKFKMCVACGKIESDNENKEENETKTKTNIFSIV